jgi:hypothetical protein
MHARPLDAFAATLIFVLCIVWGFNQVAVKLALPDVGPIAQIGIRSSIGALCVIAYAFFTKRCIFEIDGSEAAGVLAGALFTAEFIALTNRCASPPPRERRCSLLGAFLGRARRRIPDQGRAVEADPMGGARLRLSWRCLRLRRANARRQPRGRRACVPGCGVLGGDDHRHQGDAAQTHRSDKDPSLSDRIRCANGADCGLCFRRSVADASFGDVGPPAAVARRRRGRGQLRALVLDAHALRRGRALGFHLITPLVGVLAGWLVFGETLNWGFSLAIVLVLVGLALVNWPRGAHTT